MRLSIDAPHFTQDTMQELGHVLGEWANTQNPKVTEDELCLDHRKSGRNGCRCREYVKGNNLNGERIQAGSKEFDYKRITTYDSFESDVVVLL